MKTLFLILTFCAPIVLHAQSPSKLYYEIKAGDSLLFDVGFNKCDIGQFEAVISDNFEFYHDIAGPTATKAAFVEGFKKGICSSPYRSRRVLIANTMKVYPLEKKGILYGAVQTGEHQFYEKGKDKPEYLASTAKFTHIWLLDNGRWKLSRSISYDHQKS